MTRDARGAMLGRIRAAVGDIAAPARPALPPPFARATPQDDVLPAFVAACGRVNATVEVLRAFAEVPGRIAALAIARAAFSLTVSPRGAAEPWNVRSVPAGVRLSVRHDGEPRDAMASADLGVSVADYALADTGTLVVLPGASEGRLDSLLPPLHVALVRASTLRPDLWTLVAEVDRDARLRDHSAMVFITGPSRTGDIELTLTIGVHGPVQVHVLVVDDRSEQP